MKEDTSIPASPAALANRAFSSGVTRMLMIIVRAAAEGFFEGSALIRAPGLASVRIAVTRPRILRPGQAPPAPPPPA